MKRGLLAGVLCAFVLAAPAAAAGDERIVFQSNRHGGANEIYSMRPDATDIRRLTWNEATDRLPRYSFGGERIVFVRNADVWVMNADGTDERQLTSGAIVDEAPVFTRSGEQVVFERHAGPGFACPCGLWIVGVDGGEPRPLDLGPGDELHPDVAETGKLAFASNRDGAWGIFVARLHGGHGQRVTTGPAAFGDFRPRWAPRGNQLVFMRDDGANNNDIWVVRADGTGLAQVTNGERLEEQAGWSPDGERIIFTVFAGSGTAARLLTIRPDGTDQRVLPQLAAPLVEGFDDGRIDPSTWHQVLTGTGSSLEEADGRLLVDFAAGASSSIGAHVGLQCQLVGDFDVQVAYELLDWPAVNGFQAYLAGFTPSTSAQVFRESKPWGERYGSWIDPSFAATDTLDTAGMLRLVRTGGVVTASYLGGGGWVPLNVSTRPEPMTAAVGAGDFQTFAGLHTRVAYDDFHISSGALACPSWWRDQGPDWSVTR